MSTIQEPQESYYAGLHGSLSEPHMCFALRERLQKRLALTLSEVTDLERAIELMEHNPSLEELLTILKINCMIQL